MLTNRTRLPHRVIVERDITRRREREHRHQQTWGGLTQYYKTFDTANAKYEEWTSPRYYDSNNQMLDSAKKAQEKADSLQARREKLRKLLTEEEKSYEIELTVKTRNNLLSNRQKIEDIPTELLKDVNLGLKIAEDDRRRHEAEIGLYHQWRRNNPVVRDYERCLKKEELKLSWLDQQIEKRMQKEREEQECRKILAEREESIKRAREEEKQLEKRRTEQALKLQEDIAKQIETIEQSHAKSEELKKQEAEEFMRRTLLQELEEKRKLDEARIKNYEIALENIKHHKVKLKRKAAEIQENIDREQELMKQILESDVADAIEDEKKRKEIRQTVEQFLQFAREQKRLEKDREKYLDFVFDSEAKIMYEKQSEIWEEERKSRQALLKDVLQTIKVQIEEKLEKNRRRQLEVLKEREENLKAVEEYDRELEREQQESGRRKQEQKKILDEQIKEKNAIRNKLKSLQQKDLDLQLQKAQKEEERLKREIQKLQMRKDKVPGKNNNSSLSKRYFF